ncbi:MAG: hypothetical protein KME64_39085 [Scytonematopsis contorta HA4267-MV1]|jgi:hypothetical protein|nr:hypothetical protein [Scytonematopsis contorta HA4267-MV1]
MCAASNNVCVAGAARIIARRHVATHQNCYISTKSDAVIELELTEAKNASG